MPRIRGYARYARAVSVRHQLSINVHIARCENDKVPLRDTTTLLGHRNAVHNNMTLTVL